MAQIALMLDPKPGTNIVLDDLEYQTIFPFTIRKKHGVKTRVVMNTNGYMDIDKLEAEVDDKTRAVVLSAVSCWNGYRYDLKRVAEIAHKHGAYLVLDGAQIAGAVRVDFERSGVDFMATCAHKWLLVTPGTGFMYVRKSLIEEFDPPLPGWMSVTDPGGQDVWHPVFAKTAQRYETGAPNFILLAAAKASLQMLHKIGLANIEKEILKNSQYMIEKLIEIGVTVCTPVEERYRAGLVTFLLKNHESLYRELAKNSIVAYHHPMPVVKNLRWKMGGLRADPSFFTTVDEMDSLLSYVRKHA